MITSLKGSVCGLEENVPKMKKADRSFWEPKQLDKMTRESVHHAGISGRKFAVQNNDIHEADYEDRLIDE